MADSFPPRALPSTRGHERAQAERSVQGVRRAAGYLMKS
jgi:hypothetical protein